MHPVLFHLGEYPVPTFGVLALLGVFVGIVFHKREGARLGFDPRKVEELALLTILASWAGAKGLYFLQNFEAARAEPWKVVTGGYVLYGGVIAGAPVAYLLGRRAGISGARLLDLLQPGMIIGLAIGRVGCLCGGCDYGLPARSAAWYTLTFTDPRGLVPYALLGKPLLPSQPLMALGLLVTFIIVYAARKRLTPWPGVLLFLTLTVEPSIRFLIEYTRGDADRGFVGPLSASQAIALVFAPLSLAVLLWRTSRAKTPVPAPWVAPGD